MFLLESALPGRLYLLQALASEYEYSSRHGSPSAASLLYLLIIPLILYYIVKLVKGIDPTNHWQHHFDSLHYSSQQFYSALEQAITHKEMPDLKISRVLLTEAGIGSAHRMYLRLARKNLLFDVCAAPFGHGFFVSWWQGERKNPIRLFIAAFPFVGKYLDRAFYPITYYGIDTEEMFKNSIHTLVLNIVDEITKDKGVRGLTELERKPVEAKR